VSREQQSNLVDPIDLKVFASRLNAYICRFSMVSHHHRPHPLRLMDGEVGIRGRVMTIIEMLVS